MEMAVRTMRRIKGKRYDYVSKDDSQTSGFSSSDEGHTPYRRHRKVRDSKSIKMLLKDSNRYETGEDHPYSAQIEWRPPRRNSDSVSTVSKRARCVSKNAINARINRERKKVYVSSLEEEVKILKEENDSFAATIKTQNDQVAKLREEVTQLKGLLANNKYLGALVNKLSEVTGLPVSSSLISPQKKNICTETDSHPRLRSVPYNDNHPISGKDVVLNSGITNNSDLSSDMSEECLFPLYDEFSMGDFDTCEFLPYEYNKPSDPDDSGGICVHFNQKRLSVEFCSACNARAVNN